MKAGGGHAKGARWEREVGKSLSLWLTAGERPDIFSRNVLSGGAFTVATKAGKTSSRMPGDLMAANPLAFAFLSRYMVECKHLKSLSLEYFILDAGRSSPLMRIIDLSRSQARVAGVEFFIVAKQNQRDPCAIVSVPTGRKLLAAHGKSGRFVVPPVYHVLHRESLMMFRFGDLLAHAKPHLFLE